MTKQIKDNITKLVKSIDEELSVTFIKGGRCTFETATNTINIDFAEINEEDDFGFLRNLKEVHKCDFAYDYSLVLWTILHEIGHYETEWELLESDDEAELRFWLSLTPKEKANDIIIQDKYYGLTAEWIATEWAIEWITDHKKIAKQFKV